MIAGFVALLGAAAALAQLGAVPALFPGAPAAPLLPVALIAAWSAVRDPREAWPALLVASVLLGAASEERVGWYLIALLPALALAMMASLPPGARRAGLAVGGAAAGAVAYLALLTLAAGRASALGSEAGTLAVAALWTAAATALLAAALWPLRPRTAGLFE